MKEIIFSKHKVVTGRGSLSYLSGFSGRKVMTLFYEYPEFNFDNVFGNPNLPEKLNTVLVAVP